MFIVWFFLCFLCVFFCIIMMFVSDYIIKRSKSGKMSLEKIDEIVKEERERIFNAFCTVLFLITFYFLLYFAIKGN